MRRKGQTFVLAGVVGVGLLALGLALTAAACFEPLAPACAFSCGENGACPPSYACASDGLCHREGDQGICALSPVDAGAD